MRRPIARALRVPLLLLPLLAAYGVPRAHAVEERAWISLEVGADLYDPEQALRDGPGFGLRAAGFLNRWAGIEGTFHTSSPKLEYPAAGDATFTHYGAGLIVTPDRFRWSLPYFVVGAGLAKVDRGDAVGPGPIDSESHSAFHFGGGIILRLGERLGVRLDGRDITYKQAEGPGRATRVNSFVVSGALTAFLAGRTRDTDSDGVPDKKDRCTETPPGAVVDASGCPLDTDADKVFDGLDQCAGTPPGAMVDAKGCPIDADGDGIADGIDKCDSTLAGVRVDATGCPLDSDQDGVYDGPDQCPGTLAGARVDAKGCPVDSDQDGVPDGVDTCPETPPGASVNAGGCPLTVLPLERAMIQDFMIRLTDLQFVPDSARILPAGMARLDSVAVVLQQWPMLRFDIGVHVDDSPAPGYRVPLTGQRAQAVLRYLLQSHPSLNAKSFSLTGFGATDPLVSNTTTANRRRNRRVEFKVLNPDLLSQERQRRQSFGATPAPSTPGGGTEPGTPPPGEAPPPPPSGEAPTPPQQTPQGETPGTTK